MYEEIKSVIPILDGVQYIPALDRNFVIGRYKSFQIILGVTGCGSIAAGITTQFIIDNFQIDKIYLIGTAGGLRNKIKGSMYYISKVSCDIQEYPVISLNQTSNGMYLFTTSHTVCSSKEKKELEEKEYDLVDMEGYGVALASSLMGIPCEIIKVVSDVADENFNQEFSECFDSDVQIPCDWLIQELDCLTGGKEKYENR